jgi:diguanylate cyclase (GGDEF)-like protein
LTNPNRLYEGLDSNERRDLYTNALNKALGIFVSYIEKDIDDILSHGLWPIANAAGLDRIIVFRIADNDAMLSGEKYRWDRLMGGTAPIDVSLKELPITSATMRWKSIISDDSCICLKRSQFKEDEAAFLSSRGVMSILIAPVFTEGKLWGVVTCHDNTKERDFDKDCIAMLHSAARMCASTVIRAEKTRKAEQAVKALRRRERMTDTLYKISFIFLSQKEDKFEDTITAGVRLVTNELEIDRLILYRNHIKEDTLHMSQIYRWDKDSGGSTGSVEVFTDTSYAQFMPNWEDHLADGNSVNSPAKMLPVHEAAVLQSFGIRSVAVIPIHINHNFWGFALFGDTRSERHFEDDVVEMMRSAAFLFANAFIRAEVEYDALTGIYNRRYFDETMERLISSLSRSGSLLSMMMIDIDFFKRYNDTYGHIEGDRCLKAVAQTLSLCITRADDFVARYGGEEFIVVLPNTDEQGARMIAEKMLDSIRDMKMTHEKSEAAEYVTVSIGGTTGKVLHTHNAGDFVRKADELMYKSKQEGRNRFSFGLLQYQ